MSNKIEKKAYYFIGIPQHVNTFCTLYF